MASSANLKILGVIPARGGSKRLPRKNILPLAGKPLIQWTLDAARLSGCCSRIAVSSDDAEILALAQACPDIDSIERPADLASDTATSAAVVLHVLQHYAAQGEQFDAIMLLQPTSPLRTSDDIRAAVALFSESGAASVISVSPVEHSPLWTITLSKDGSLDALIDRIVTLPSTRSQDLPAHYRLNGALYLTKAETFLISSSFFNKPSRAYVMSTERSVDIDTQIEFALCNTLLAELHSSESSAQNCVIRS